MWRYPKFPYLKTLHFSGSNNGKLQVIYYRLFIWIVRGQIKLNFTPQFLMKTFFQMKKI